MIQWVVQVHFGNRPEDELPIRFLVNYDELADVFSHLAKMSFEQEVFKIEFWQRRNA